MSLNSYWDMLKKTYVCWKEDNASRLAAALAYYTAFSIAPILIISIAISGLVFGKAEAQGHILNQISVVVGPKSASQIQAMIENVSKPSSSITASIIGLVVLIFAAVALFNQLQDGLNTIWGVKPQPNRHIIQIVKDRFFPFTMLLGTSFVLLVSLTLNAIILALSHYINSLFPGIAYFWVGVNFFSSLIIITILFAMIFKILPDVLIKWHDVWKGAFLAAILFTCGKFFLELYLSKNDIGSVYGAAGSLVVILFWVYYSAQILFFGAEFTKVCATKNNTPVIPAKNAVLTHVN